MAKRLLPPKHLRGYKPAGELIGYEPSPEGMAAEFARGGPGAWGAPWDPQARLRPGYHPDRPRSRRTQGGYWCRYPREWERLLPKKETP